MVLTKWFWPSALANLFGRPWELGLSLPSLPHCSPLRGRAVLHLSQFHPMLVGHPFLKGLKGVDPRWNCNPPPICSPLHKPAQSAAHNPQIYTTLVLPHGGCTQKSPAFNLEWVFGCAWNRAAFLAVKKIHSPHWKYQFSIHAPCCRSWLR